MKTRIALKWILIVTICSALAISTGRAQTQKKKSVVSTPKTTLWQSPGAVEKLDFNHGPGGSANAPKPPFTFLQEDTFGTTPKIEVRDAGGREWGVKWGSEVNSEVFATRMVWAAGYFVEPTYFVAKGKFKGVTKLSRAKDYVDDDGNFGNARFKLKQKGITKFFGEQSWDWTKNPFVGTKELNGLKVLMMLLSNWDSKDKRDAGRGSNTVIFLMPGTSEYRYLVADWGGSMGKWGGFLKREKWDCEGFSKQTEDFIDEVEDGEIEFNYSGQHKDSIRDGITKSDVRWLLTYIGRVSDNQIRAGLKASGAAPAEVDCFASALRQRINMLKENSR